MAQIVGVRFKPVGKIYHFNPAGFEIKKDDYVVVETSRGVELGKVVVAKKEISPEHINKPLKDVLRIATADDLRIAEENRKKEKEAFAICLEKSKTTGLK